jgi:hypothetical protein
MYNTHIEGHWVQDQQNPTVENQVSQRTQVLQQINCKTEKGMESGGEKKHPN